MFLPRAALLALALLAAPGQAADPRVTSAAPTADGWQIAVQGIAAPEFQLDGHAVTPRRIEGPQALDEFAEEVFQLAETLRNAYVINDRETFVDNCTNDGYRELVGAIKKFDKAELIFTPTWVEIKDSSVYLSVSWNGVWTLGTKTREERGLGLFVLEGKPLKLAKVQRDNPFSQPE